MSNLITVLVIEDELAVFKFIEEILKTNKPVGWPLKYRLQNAATIADAVRVLGNARWDIVILDLTLPDSKGIESFWTVSAQTKAPIIVLTGDPNGTFEQILQDGAYRCYSKADLRACMRILHYSIRHVLHEHAQKQLIQKQSETISGVLRPLVTACAGCGRVKDEVADRYVSLQVYLSNRNVVLSHGHCPDCMQDFYGKDLREATKDFK